MSVVNHLAEAAAVILLLELIIVILIFAGISGGLAFGLRWIRGKTGWAFETANAYVRIGVHYLHMGTDYAAKPLIQTSAFAEKIRVTARAIQQQVRQVHESGAAVQPSLAARGTAPEPVEETEAPVPLV